MNELIVDQVYEGNNFVQNPIKADFDACVFKSCVFAKANLSKLTFTNCSFENCDLSAVKLTQTALQECDFVDCKMLGVTFEACADFLFQINCQSCILNFSSFYQMNLSLSQFFQCQFKEADFTEANLSTIFLSECDLAGATFENTNLQKTDFSSAINYTLNPDKNKIAGAVFSKEGIAGLLASYKINIV